MASKIIRKTRFPESDDLSMCFIRKSAFHLDANIVEIAHATLLLLSDDTDAIRPYLCIVLKSYTNKISRTLPLGTIAKHRRNDASIAYSCELRPTIYSLLDGLNQQYDNADIRVDFSPSTNWLGNYTQIFVKYGNMEYAEYDFYAGQ